MPEVSLTISANDKASDILKKVYKELEKLNGSAEKSSKSTKSMSLRFTELNSAIAALIDV